MYYNLIRTSDNVTPNLSRWLDSLKFHHKEIPLQNYSPLPLNPSPLFITKNPSPTYYLITNMPLLIILLVLY